MDKKKNIVVLGVSGSIGKQTLDVVRRHNDKLKVVGLTAFSSEKFLKDVASEFNVKNTVLVSNEKNNEEANKKIEEIINLDETEIVVNAISGSAGLIASYSTLKAGKTLALANKESLVVGGDLLMPMVKKIKKNEGKLKLLPIDSEHGAIFQCLIGEEKSEIYKVHLTASGGPFYKKLTKDLENITAAEALKHPT